MEHEQTSELAKAIAWLDRAMSDLADVHSAVGLGLHRSLQTGLLMLKALDQLEEPPQGLDRVIRYFEMNPPASRASASAPIRLRWVLSGLPQTPTSNKSET